MKYVTTWRKELELPAERIAEQPAEKPVEKDQKIYAYRLAAANPRVWFAGDALVEPDGERQMQRVLEAGFDPDKQVVLDASPAPSPQEGCTGAAQLAQSSPEALRVDVSTDAPCILVLSEIAYPGWQAAVDGAAAPLLTANSVLRAVAVPAGAHTVTLTYRPLVVALGLIVSGVTLLAAAVLLAWAGRAGRRATR